jgi:predicted Zn-dependent protease
VVLVASAAMAGAAYGAFLPGAAAPSPAQAPALAGPYLAAQSAHAAGDWPTAAAFAEQALAADPNDLQLRRTGLLLQLARGDLAQATRLAADLPAETPESPLLPLMRAVEALAHGADAAAEQALLTLPDQGFQRAIRRSLLAEIESGRGDTAHAAALLQGLRERGGDSALASARLVSLALARGDAAALSAALQDFVAAEPGPGLRLTLIRRLHRAGAGAAAATLARQSLALYGEGALFAEEAAPARRAPVAPARRARETARYAEALLDLAHQAERRGSAAMTLVLARLSQRLAPQDAEVAILIGTVFERFGQPGRAIEAYAAVPARDPLARQAVLRSAMALAASGDRDAAIARLQAAAANDTAAIAALVAHGEIERGRGALAAALAAFEEAVRRLAALGLAPSWQLHFAVALTRFELGRWQAAEEPLAAALAAQPNGVQPRALAALVSLRGGDRRAAEAHAFAALEAGPDSPAALGAYAEVMLAAGKPEPAVEALEAAVALWPQKVDLNEALGDAYWRVGRRAEAGFQWRRAAESVSDAARLAKLQRKLQVGPEPDPAAPAAATRLTTAAP